MGVHVRHKWWRIIRHLLTAVFFVAVITLLAAHLRSVDVMRVLDSIHQYDIRTLAAAAVLAGLSYLVYSCFDLLGRLHTKHSLEKRRVIPIAFVSYAFNQNLGALIGGVGFRYRLYSRQGLAGRLITRILTFSIVTNWLGYSFLAGGIFATRSITLPPGWEIGTDALQVLGIVLLGVVILYLMFCILSRRRSWFVGRYEVKLPSLGVALMQLALGTTNWLIMATVIALLLRLQVEFTTVLGLLLLSAIGGVLTQIPAGLGVFEAVFIKLLDTQVGQGDLLAALLAYRAVYYLAPLLLATIVYLGLEAKANQRRDAAKRLPTESA